MIKSIIVTGATGAVTCIVHQGSKRLGNLPQDERLKIVECNLSDYKNLQMEGKYDAFIHLSWEKTFGASRDDAEVQTRNIQYTLDAVQLAHRCGCTVFVGAGSQAEYGIVPGVITEETPCNPFSAYGKAKLEIYHKSRELA